MFLKEFFEKVNFETSQQKNHEKLPSMHRVKGSNDIFINVFLADLKISVHKVV